MSKDREIYQLWYTALTYCNLAQTLISQKDIPDPQKHVKISELAKCFEKGIPQEKSILDCNMLNAHLSSAAIRLYTISEKDCHCTIRDNYLKEYQSNLHKSEDIATIKKYLFNNKGRFIHSLLRDNIGHEEESEKRKDLEQLFKARQELLNDLEILEIYTLMEDIKNKFATEFQLPLVK